MHTAEERRNLSLWSFQIRKIIFTIEKESRYESNI